MQIDIPHQLSIEKSKEKIDAFLDELIKKSPIGGVSITNPRKEWHEGKYIQMSFFFNVSKSLFSTSINGYITLMTGVVILVIPEIPNMVRMFVDESEIREVIKKEAEALLV
jgi:hypothetical protein